MAVRQTPERQSPGEQAPVQAVIFDWGGTLTPWHTVDHVQLWRRSAPGTTPKRFLQRPASAIRAAEQELWRAAERDHRSATMDHVFERAGVTPSAASWPATSRPGSRTR